MQTHVGISSRQVLATPSMQCPACSKEYEADPGRLKHGRQTSCSRECSYILRGKKMSIAQKGRPSWSKGKKLSEAHILKLRESHLGQIAWNKGLVMPEEIAAKQRGANSHFWRGGVTPQNTLIRMSSAYSRWRKAVFERDGFTCQECFVIGGTLNADHIKPFSLFPELRTELSNGRTLCVECHRKTATFGRKALKFQLQLQPVNG